MKTWKPWCVWWTLRNQQNEVNDVWMFSWKVVVTWMLQVVYRVHYVLWCCLVCLQHYFCLHSPDYNVGNVEWERKKENSHSISITFPHFYHCLSMTFIPMTFLSPFNCFNPHLLYPSLPHNFLPKTNSKEK